MEVVRQVAEVEVAAVEAAAAAVVGVAVAAQCECSQLPFLLKFSHWSSHCYHSWSLKIASLICSCAVVFLSCCSFCSS